MSDWTIVPPRTLGRRAGWCGKVLLILVVFLLGGCAVEDVVCSLFVLGPIGFWLLLILFSAAASTTYVVSPRAEDVDALRIANKRVSAAEAEARRAVWAEHKAEHRAVAVAAKAAEAKRKAERRVAVVAAKAEAKRKAERRAVSAKRKGEKQ